MKIATRPETSSSKSFPAPVSYDVLGVPIAVTTPEATAKLVESWAGDDIGRFVCMRDVSSLMTIIADPQLASLHHEASMITPDGMPLVLIGRRRGLPVLRTCGPDLMELLLQRSVESGLRHYFYGGLPGVAGRLADIFTRRFPGIAIVGHESPPFRPLTDEEDRDAVLRIAQSGADIVWVGMSSPKQDIWMRDHYRQLPQTLIGVGAAFDFHSGRIARAPLWMQRNYLEWLHRVAQEPHRLWRRYLLHLPKFLLRIAVAYLTAQRRSHSARLAVSGERRAGPEH